MPGIVMSPKVILLTMLTLVSCAESSPGLFDPAPSQSTSPSPSGVSFTNGGRCPRASDPSLAGNAGCVTSVVRGDANFSVYARMGDTRRPRTWWMHVSGPGVEIDQRLQAGNAYSYPRAVGATDIDEDGAPEWWVKVMDFTSHGAPWSRLNLFVGSGDSLVPISYEKEPLSVNFGGIARLGEGAACRDGRLVLLRAEAQNVRNTRWRVIERSFEIAGGTARFLGRTEDTLMIEDYNDPDLDPYYLVTCEGL